MSDVLNIIKSLEERITKLEQNSKIERDAFWKEMIQDCKDSVKPLYEITTDEGVFKGRIYNFKYTDTRNFMFELLNNVMQSFSYDQVISFKRIKEKEAPVSGKEEVPVILYLNKEELEEKETPVLEKVSVKFYQEMLENFKMSKRPVVCIKSKTGNVIEGRIFNLNLLLGYQDLDIKSFEIERESGNKVIVNFRDIVEYNILEEKKDELEEKENSIPVKFLQETLLNFGTSKRPYYEIKTKNCITYIGRIYALSNLLTVEKVEEGYFTLETESDVLVTLYYRDIVSYKIVEENKEEPTKDLDDIISELWNVVQSLPYYTKNGISIRLNAIKAIFKKQDELINRLIASLYKKKG